MLCELFLYFVYRSLIAKNNNNKKRKQAVFYFWTQHRDEMDLVAYYSTAFKGERKWRRQLA